MADPARPWARAATGLRLVVRLTPRGGRDALGGIVEAGGRPALAARVAAPPADGAANAALRRLVAKAAGVPPRDVRLASGATGRVKTLEIAGEPDALTERLAARVGDAD